LDVEELYSVGTIRHGSDESSGYLLAVVSHLTAPLDEVDVVNQERKETAVCDCSGWYHHAHDQEIGAKIGDCKHTERVKELRGTEMPDDQATLV